MPPIKNAAQISAKITSAFVILNLFIPHHQEDGEGRPLAVRVSTMEHNELCPPPAKEPYSLDDVTTLILHQVLSTGRLLGPQLIPSGNVSAKP